MQTESASADSVEKNVELNLEKALSFIRRAAGSGIGLAVFPELFTTGYFPGIIAEAGYERLTRTARRATDFLSRASKEFGMIVAAGMPDTEPEPEPAAYNTVRVFMPDGTAVKPYRKNLLFPVSREPELFAPGSGLVSFTAGSFTVGILICYEIRFPELSRRYMDVPCDLLIIPAAFPASRGHHWRTLVQARAIENQMYAASANHTGAFGTVGFAGSSMIVDPSGAVAASAPENGETMITAVLSKETIRTVREHIPCYRDRERLADRF